MLYVALRNIKFRAALNGRLVFKQLWLLHVVGFFATKKVPSLTHTVAQTVALWKYWQVMNTNRGGEGRGPWLRCPCPCISWWGSVEVTPVQWDTLIESPPPLELPSHFGCAVKENWEMLPLMPHGMLGTAVLEVICSLLQHVSFGVLPLYSKPDLAGGFITL